MTQICIIAGNYKEALAFAKSQNIEPNCWFYPTDESDLLRRSNFHVLVIGTAGENVPASYFERIYQIAQKRGCIGRL